MQIGMRLIRATYPGMARGLLRLGQQAAADNRTFAKVQGLAADGAESAQTLFGLTEELTPHQAVRHSGFCCFLVSRGARTFSPRQFLG